LDDPAVAEAVPGVFAAAPVGMALLDVSGKWLRVNSALARLLGRSPEELLAAAPATLFELDEPVVDPSGGSGPASTATVEMRYRHRDGYVVWVRRRTVVLRDDRGEAAFLLATFEDVGARREEDDRLARLALHDPLTGLANRALLDDRLAQAMAARERDGGTVVVLFCDVDGLKAINDRHGHDFGDQLLIAVAQRLVGQVRSGDTVARFGGDEFVVVCHLRAGHDAESMAARLTTAVEGAPELLAPDGTKVPVRVSVGQEIGRGNVDPPALLRGADSSMYAAKRNRGLGPWPG